MSPASTSFSLRQAFFEAFFVLLGVGLALVGNAWWESRQRAEHAAIAIDAIEAELRANLEAVRASHDYHHERLELIYGWSEDEPPTARDFPRGFTHPAQVLSTAWTAARESGALVDLPYRRLLALSNVYADQERYTEQARLVGSLIYEALLARGTDGLLANFRNLGSIIGTFQFRETQLIERYEETLGLRHSPG